MIAFLLAFGLNAAPLVSFESVLARPIDARVKAFAGMGVRGREFLRRTAFDRSEALQTRWRAITTMGRLDPRAFGPELDRALKSPEWFVRNAALIATLSDDRPRALDAAGRLLADPALVVRTQAVRNLIALDARESEPALWRALYDQRNFKGKESLWIRAHIAEALSRFAARGRVKAFERMLMDEDARLHRWAVVGLESATGLRMSDRKEDVEVRRQKWIARLGLGAI